MKFRKAFPGSFNAAAHYHLDNYILIIDRNGLQSGGNTEDIISEDPLKLSSCIQLGCADHRRHDIKTD